MQAKIPTYKERITTQTIEREIVPDFVDVRLPKKHRFNNGSFITLFQDPLYDIITIIKANLSKPELMLLVYFISIAKTDAAVTLNLDFLVAELGLKKQNISTAIGILVKRNIILKKCVENGDKKKGKPNYYELSLSTDRLNYNLAWKGKVKDYKSVQHKDPKIETKLLDAPKLVQLTLFDNE